jgi:methylated-DNA-[protein]-cysteine S-methyltransferase
VELFTTQAGLKSATLIPSSSFQCRFADGDYTEAIVEWLRAYALKEPVPLNFPLDFEGMSDFHKKGLGQLSSIPWGKVRSYGQIAEKLGNLGLARAVGSVCRRNPWPLFIPCHRVIAAGNKLGGFAYGLPMKEMLLRFENFSGP